MPAFCKNILQLGPLSCQLQMRKRSSSLLGCRSAVEISSRNPEETEPHN